jgi:hypothetical protein
LTAHPKISAFANFASSFERMCAAVKRCNSLEIVHFWKILLAYHSTSAALFTPIRPYADTVVIFGCGFAALRLGVFA